MHAGLTVLKGQFTQMEVLSSFTTPSIATLYCKECFNHCCPYDAIQWGPKQHWCLKKTGHIFKYLFFGFTEERKLYTFGKT